MRRAASIACGWGLSDGQCNVNPVSGRLDQPTLSDFDGWTRDSEGFGRFDDDVLDGGGVGLGGAGRGTLLSLRVRVAAMGMFRIDFDLCRRYAASDLVRADAMCRHLQTERDRLVDGDFTGVPEDVTIEDWFHRLEQALAILTSQQ